MRQWHRVVSHPGRSPAARFETSAIMPSLMNDGSRQDQRARSGSDVRWTIPSTRIAFRYACTAGGEPLLLSNGSP